MTERKPTSNGASVSGVVRTFRVLQAVARHEAIGLSEVARELRIHKSTVLRFLTTLCDLGYLKRVPGTEAYALTLKLFELGATALDHMDVVEQSQAILEWLAAETAETVHLATRENDSVVYLNKIDSPHSLRMYSRIGKLAPLYCTGLGKALLAWLPEEILRELYAHGKLEIFTPNTIASLRALHVELEQIRRLGYSWDHEEHEPGIRCVAAPVFDRNGCVCAALSVAWPTARNDPDTEKQRAPLVLKAAQQVTRSIGGTPPATFPTPDIERGSKTARGAVRKLAELDGAPAK